MEAVEVVVVVVAEAAAAVVEVIPAFVRTHPASLVTGIVRRRNTIQTRV